MESDQGEQKTKGISPAVQELLNRRKELYVVPSLLIELITYCLHVYTKIIKALGGYRRKLESS
jgi:hypothetical protein